jgi:hypothetical protein
MPSDWQKERLPSKAEQAAINRKVDLAVVATTGVAVFGLVSMQLNRPRSYRHMAVGEVHGHTHALLPFVLAIVAMALYWYAIRPGLGRNHDRAQKAIGRMPAKAEGADRWAWDLSLLLDFFKVFR